MATSKEHYSVNDANDLESLKRSLNRILSRIQDRLDKIEGGRGTATITDGLTVKSNDQILHGFNTSDEV